VVSYPPGPSKGLRRSSPVSPRATTVRVPSCQSSTATLPRRPTPKNLVGDSIGGASRGAIDEPMRASIGKIVSIAKVREALAA
jgi:hypothetical protein